MFYRGYIYKLLRVSILSLIIFPLFQGFSQVHLTEGFESGAKPEGWTEEYISGTEPWRFRNGGHSPNDNNWLVPPAQKDITRNPPAAYEGTYNAIFFKQGDDNERTLLVTPAMNLLGGADLELSFYLCQIPWTFEGSAGWDVLRVYYKVSETSPWILLHEYLDPVYVWTQQTLSLPNPSATYYIGFEGQTRWGYGTCLDKIKVESKGLQPYRIEDIAFQQLFPKPIPSGSTDVPVMRIDFTLLGNSGSAVLESIRFNSLNTSDGDIIPNGVKLYSTTSQKFSTDNPVGTPANFVSRVANFSEINYSLPPGQSYLWLTFDISPDASYGNILDVRVAPGSILANDTLYPSAEKSPEGFRIIHRTQYFENFEATHNWTLSGEFEVNAPAGGGGSPGNPDPVSAFSGSKVLGTDLTGLGPDLYNYENDISESASYHAVSPSINLLYYKNLNLFFQRHLNIEVWDNSSIQVSADNGITWNSIWKNNSYINDFQWMPQQIAIPEAYWRTGGLMVRFQLGPTDVQNSYSGWNVDDIYITGEFISRDVGISEWINPVSGPNHTTSDSVTVRIKNYGGAEITDPVPVAYSFDGGSTWVTGNVSRNIPVGGSILYTFPAKADLSAPGPRTAIAKTIFPGDQFPGNDNLSIPIYIVPTYKPPYTENFELNDGFWRKGGNEIWEYGVPAKSVINSASSGTKCWVTGLSSTYEDLITRKNKIIFSDDFETDHGWTYSGEFERNIPSYEYLPYFANSGYYCIGTDLSGKGASPYKYENGVTPASAWTAFSPAFDVRNYSNLTVSFTSWITIRAGDSIKFEVSPDDGASWSSIWKNAGGAILEDGYSYHQFTLPEVFNNSDKLRFRFTLFSTSASGPVDQGWTIDDFLLTGNLVNTGEAYLVSPYFNLAGLSHPVFEARLWFDTEIYADGVSLQYSLDRGATWNNIANSSSFDSYWNWYTGNFVTAIGSDGWSGQSSGWKTVRHLLPPALIDQTAVQFRLKFRADMVNNQYDGVAVDDIRIIEAPSDLGVTEIISPVTACELRPDQAFTLRLKNHGIRNLPQGEQLRIGYRINRSGQLQVSEETLPLPQTLPVGSTLDLVMAKEFDFSVAGQYQVDVYTIEADPFFYHPVSNDSIRRVINVNKPKADLGPDISTIRPDLVILKAYSGVKGNTYLWHDGSADSVYHVSSAGKYYVRVSNLIGCTASDTINIKQLVADAGVSELVAPLSSCTPGNQERIRIKIRNYGTDTLEINDNLLIGAKINSDLLSSTLVLTRRLAPGDTMTYIFPAAYNFSAIGNYQMKIFTRLTEDNNYSNDTLRYNLEVYGKPVIDLGNDVVAAAAEYTLTAPHGYAAYRWQDGSASESFVVRSQGEGVYNVTVTDGNQCSNADTVRVTLNVTDIAISRILSPGTSCTSSDSVPVSVRLKNAGNLPVEAGRKIRLSYSFEGGAAGADSISLQGIFLPGDSIDFSFRRKAKVSRGTWYNLSCSLDYPADLRASNNTVNVPVGIFATPIVSLGEDYKVVAATSYTLDAGPGFASYLWNDGSTGRTMTINTPGINKYSVFVKDINGCTAFDEISIMMAVPDLGITAILNPVTSCSSGSGHVKIALRNEGNWDIDRAAGISVTYSINGGPLVRESVILNSVFEKGSVIYFTFGKEENFTAGQNTIIAAIDYQADLQSANNSMTSAFTISQSPVISLSQSDTLMISEPFTLSAPTGYASYRWQDGSQGSSYEVRQPGSALYSVQVTATNGCAARDSVFIIYDSPDIGITRIIAPVTSCTGNPASRIIFMEIVNNGTYRIPANRGIPVSFTVNNGAPVTKTVLLTSPLEPSGKGILTFDSGYDFSEPGICQLKISLVNPDKNLANNTITGTVTIWNNPLVEIGGEPDTLKNQTLPVRLDAGPGYASYTWQDNSKKSWVEATSDGLYWVKVTDSNGCFSVDSVYVISGEEKEFPGKISIYPNPVNEILHLEVEMDIASDLELELFGFSNSLLYREDLRDIRNTLMEIDARGFAPGIYFLRIKADRSHKVLKVIVN